MSTSDVIFLSFANSEKNPLFFLKDEIDGAYNKLFGLKEKNIIDVVREESITAEDVRLNFIERYQNRIVIFHYGGHADGDLLLFDKDPVFAQGLAGFLGRQENLKLVFLNACNTLKPIDDYLKAGVKALIATTLPVADGAACLFAVTFYTSLANNATIEQSYFNAVDAIKLKSEKYKKLKAVVTEYRTIDREAAVTTVINPWELIVVDKRLLKWKISKSNEMLRLLRAGSEQHYKHLRNGRYKYLKISDMLLSKLQTRYIETRASLAEKEEGYLYDILKMTWKEAVPHTVLFAEGGMGKTVSVIRLWENLLNAPDEPIPLFIALNEYNSVKAESDKEKFLIKKIGRNYLGKESLTEQEENDLWAILKTPMGEKEEYKPAFILFLDGFNELSGDKTKLLLELKEIAATAAGVQIVVTSRYDMRNFTWTASFSLIIVQPLSEQAINDYFDYLANELGTTISLPANNQMRRLLANPFMLTLFTASAARVVHYQNNDQYDFKKKSNSYGELMWNFIESQVVKFYEEEESNPGKAAYYHFLLRHFLPYIGFEMEKRNQFFLTATEIKKVIAGACTYFYRKEFIDAFTLYDEYLDLFDINLEEKGFAKSARRVAEILDTLSENMLMLVEEDEAFRFLHQHFRDFFSAVHVLNETRLCLNNQLLSELLQERVIPAAVRKAMGEIEGEQYNKPVFNHEQKKWGRGEARDSVLIKLIDNCRKLTGKANTRFLVWNILTIWNDVRGELTGEWLNDLDLQSCSFGDLLCFRIVQGQYLSADFSNSIFKPDAFYLKGHSRTITSIVVNKAGTRCLTAADDGLVKEWDLGTGVCLATANCNEKVEVVKYSYDESMIMAGCDNGVLFVFSADLQKEIVHKKNTGMGKLVKHLAVSDTKVAIASYFHDVFLYDWEMLVSTPWSGWVKSIDNKDVKIIGLEWNANFTRLLVISLHQITEVYWVNGKMGVCTYSQDAGQGILAATYSRNGDEIIGITTGITDEHLIVKWPVTAGAGQYNYTTKIPVQTKVYDGVVFDDGKSKGIFAVEFRNNQLYQEAIEVDLETGKPLNTFRVNRDIISTVTYSKAGKEVLIGTQAGFMYKYSTKTGELLHTFLRTPGKITYAVFSAAGDTLLCYSSNGVLHEFSTETLTCFNQVKQHDFYITFSWYTNNGDLMSVAGNGEIKYWERNTGCAILIYTLKESPYQVQPVGDQFLALRYYDVDSKERKIELLDLKTWTATTVLQTQSDNLAILCSGTHAFFIQENNNDISNIYYCDVESKVLQLVDKVWDERLELFKGDCNAAADFLCIVLAKGKIQTYQLENATWKKVKEYTGIGEPVAVSLLQNEKQVGIIRRKGHVDVVDLETGSYLESEFFPITVKDDLNIYIKGGGFQQNGTTVVYQYNDVVYLYDRVTKSVRDLSLTLGPLVCNCNFKNATGLEGKYADVLQKYGALF